MAGRGKLSVSAEAEQVSPHNSRAMSATLRFTATEGLTRTAPMRAKTASAPGQPQAWASSTKMPGSLAGLVVILTLALVGAGAPCQGARERH